MGRGGLGLIGSRRVVALLIVLVVVKAAAVTFILLSGSGPLAFSGPTDAAQSPRPVLDGHVPDQSNDTSDDSDGSDEQGGQGDRCSASCPTDALAAARSASQTL